MTGGKALLYSRGVHLTETEPRLLFSLAYPFCEVLVPGPLLQSTAGALPALRGESRGHGGLLRPDLSGGDPTARAVDAAGAGGAALGGQRRATF